MALNNIEYMFLDYDFLDSISIICDNKQNGFINNSKYIANLKDKFRIDLKSADSLIVLLFNKNNLNVYFTNGENEISEIFDVFISTTSKNKLHVFITYLDGNNIPREGYILKFNNNFIIYRNSFDKRITNMSNIPYLNEVKRNDIYVNVKNQFNSLLDLIKYLKDSNKIYVQSSFKDYFENSFNIENIKLNYYNNKFRIEYIDNNKKYNIIILKEYNLDDQYSYIGIIYEISNKKIQLSKNNEEKTDSPIRKYLAEIDNNLYEVGLYDLMIHYKLYSPLDDSIVDYIYEQIYKNKKSDIINKNIFSNNFHSIFNKKLKLNLDNISDVLTHKKETSYIKNLIDNFHNVKSCIINDTSNIINLKQKIDFTILNLFQLADEEKYFISLDKDNKIYEFALMEINPENIVAILKEVNNIEKDKLIYIISIKSNEEK